MRRPFCTSSSLILVLNVVIYFCLYVDVTALLHRWQCAATDACHHGDEIITNLWLAMPGVTGRRWYYLQLAGCCLKKCYACIFPSFLHHFIFSRWLLASHLGVADSYSDKKLTTLKHWPRRSETNTQQSFSQPSCRVTGFVSNLWPPTKRREI